MLVSYTEGHFPKQYVPTGNKIANMKDTPILTWNVVEHIKFTAIPY